jgi:hypothetical protein
MNRLNIQHEAIDGYFYADDGIVYLDTGNRRLEAVEAPELDDVPSVSKLLREFDGKVSGCSGRIGKTATPLTNWSVKD